MKEIKRGFRKAVFIVVYKKNSNGIKYLILHRKHHWNGWEFPKGGIEKKEAEINAVKRELKEETGLKEKKILKYNKKGKYSYNKIFKDRKGLRGQTYSLYSAEVGEGRIKIDRKEHSGFKWADFKKVFKILKWPNQKKSIKIVNKRINKK